MLALMGWEVPFVGTIPRAQGCPERLRKLEPITAGQCVSSRVVPALHGVQAEYMGLIGFLPTKVRVSTLSCCPCILEYFIPLSQNFPLSSNLPLIVSSLPSLGGFPSSPRQITHSHLHTPKAVSIIALKTA